MAGWTPSFDVYMAVVDDAPTSFVVDMGAAGHAPLASHPVRIQVRSALLRPLSNGLRDASEVDSLGELEDAIVERLASAVDAVYVGRFLGAGEVTFVLYAPEGTSDDDLTAPLGALGDYRARWDAEEDAGWSTYFEFLYPDEASHLSMMNRQQLAQRREMGDRLDVPREIDHFAVFPSLAQANAAAVTLGDAGFRVSNVEQGEDGETFGVQFHREETLDGDKADAFCEEILDLVEPHDGDYDGWGGAVIKGDS